MKKKILIVGGVAGGATAAARLRRLNEDAHIIMFERDEYISFANCGLPYYIGGVIEDRDKLLVQSVKGMSERYNLDIRNFSEVISVNRTAKSVSVKNTITGEQYEESYDVLLLSPGAKPLKPPIKGLDKSTDVYVLRNIADTDAIKDRVTGKNQQSAVVVGGGFIGVEMAENLREAGLSVTLVEKLPQVLRPLDFEMAQIVHKELNENGVALILGDGIVEFDDGGRTVVLESGKRLLNDLVILAIGVAPENSLAKSASLALGPRGHIRTDDKFRTFDAESGEVVEDIYAIGDAIEVRDLIDGSKTAIPLAGPANRQGRLVADYISGRNISYPGALGTSVAKVFNLIAATTGNNESLLKAKNIPYRAVNIHRTNHATYYPGASNISLKLLFSPLDGRILGAQAVGKEGTEKRIDVIATAIALGGTVHDLAALELSYAPPYSSAKDPVNVLGYVASNALEGEYGFVQYYQIDDIVKNGGFLLDVRTPYEFRLGNIKGSVNIPVDDLRDRLGEITVSKDTPIYITCRVGMRAHIAAMILKGKGFTKVNNLSGGYLTYEDSQY